MNSSKVIAKRVSILDNDYIDKKMYIVNTVTIVDSKIAYIQDQWNCINGSPDYNEVINSINDSLRAYISDRCDKNT
jgi:myo-inositol-1-phosphate synthase